MGLLIFAPLLVITLLYFILDDSSYIPKIAVFDINEQILTQVDENAELNILDQLPDDENYLEVNKLDALFYTDLDGLKLILLEQNSKSTAALKAITDAVGDLQKNSPNQIETSYVYETDSENLLDSMSYVILGVISFFFVFILSGMSFVRERFGQTLERMLMTPISRVDVIGGYTIGYGILAALQSVVIILYSAYVLSIHIEGSV
ncbi:MAG: type transport system permease protein, partial [Eubacteriaceae bacterium]|nr:type transport system permease protein [Eubacteriaceae bacterium]